MKENNKLDSEKPNQLTLPEAMLPVVLHSGNYWRGW